MKDFLAEIFIRMIGMYLLIVPGSALRWWFSGRKRPWKGFLLEGDDVCNYRAGLLFWIVLAALAGGGVYLIKY